MTTLPADAVAALALLNSPEYRQTLRSRGGETGPVGCGERPAGPATPTGHLPLPAGEAATAAAAGPPTLPRAGSAACSPAGGGLPPLTVAGRGQTSRVVAPHPPTARVAATRDAHPPH